MPGWAGVLALIEPLLLIGFAIWGYLALKSALAHAKSRIVSELHKKERNHQ